MKVATPRTRRASAAASRRTASSSKVAASLAGKRKGKSDENDGKAPSAKRKKTNDYDGMSKKDYLHLQHLQNAAKYDNRKNERLKSAAAAEALITKAKVKQTAAAAAAPHRTSAASVTKKMVIPPKRKAENDENDAKASPAKRKKMNDYDGMSKKDYLHLQHLQNAAKYDNRKNERLKAAATAEALIAKAKVKQTAAAAPHRTSAASVTKKTAIPSVTSAPKKPAHPVVPVRTFSPPVLAAPIKKSFMNCPRPPSVSAAVEDEPLHEPIRHTLYQEHVVGENETVTRSCLASFQSNVWSFIRGQNVGGNKEESDDSTVMEFEGDVGMECNSNRKASCRVYLANILKVCLLALVLSEGYKHCYNVMARSPSSFGTPSGSPTGSPTGSRTDKQEPLKEDPGPNFVKYWILGVPKTATMKEIKKAYHRSALKAHPDKGGDSLSFRELHDAYEMLIDVEKRKKYDQRGEKGLRDNLRSQAKGYKEWRRSHRTGSHQSHSSGSHRSSGRTNSSGRSNRSHRSGNKRWSGSRRSGNKRSFWEAFELYIHWIFRSVILLQSMRAWYLRKKNKKVGQNQKSRKSL